MSGEKLVCVTHHERHALAMKVARKVHAYAYEDECGSMNEADERELAALVAEVEAAQS